MKVLGLDPGFGNNAVTGAAACFEVQSTRISVSEVTRALSTKEQTQLAQDLQTDHVSIVALDAPLSPHRLASMPLTGREVEKAFSRGPFSSALRGPQPCSIGVPHPGWDLYQRGMDLKNLLTPRFPYLEIGHLHGVTTTEIQYFSIEVIPKLTLALLLGWEATIMRPIGVDRHYGQLDNWSFPQLFGSDSDSNWRNRLEGIEIDRSLDVEADRILQTPLSLRHELIAGFACAFQASLVACGMACVVGAPGGHEGYYALPKRWDDSWENAWSSLDTWMVQRLEINLPGTFDWFPRE